MDLKNKVLSQLKRDYGYFYDGDDEYVCIEDAYYTNGTLYGEPTAVWEARVVKTSDAVEECFGSPCLPLYQATWEPDNNNEDGIPDWDNPYDIKSYGEYDLEEMFEV